MRTSPVLCVAVLSLVGACGSVETLGGTGGSPGRGGSPGTGGQTGGGPGGAGGGTGGIAGSAGGSAGTSSQAECVRASDCMLQDDCCTCAPVPKSQPGAVCNIACLADECSTRGITAADVTCLAGRCVFDKSCNPTGITCTVATPGCSAGTLPIVTNNCYTSACLPIAQCSDVASCDACTSAGLSCVTYEALGGPSHHCVSVPAACSATPTCDCLGSCSGALVCSDPASTSPLCLCPGC